MIGAIDATTFVAETAEGVIGFVNIAFVARARPGPAHCGHVVAVSRQRDAGLGAGLLPIPFDGCVVDVR